jgi:cytochrome c-type biogenesis protein CcmH
MKRLVLVPLVLAASAAVADSNLPPAPLADTQLADPRKEAAARALMESLRCLVCQGQSIADSNAEMAGDMRALVRQRIQAGETQDQVRTFLVSRYGDWVSFSPPLDAAGWPLWIAPAVLLVGGLWLLRGRFRRHRR